jgi:putative ABC transport system permease protein
VNLGLAGPPAAPRSAAPLAPGARLRLAARLALADLRGGLSGLRLLAVCVLLGVLALAGVGSLAAAIERGLSEQGQVLLGGDVEARLTQRLPRADEQAALEALGRTSRVVQLRAMVTAETGAGAGRQALAELRAVDAAWPLVGEARIAAGGGTAAARQAIAQGAVVAEALAEQLALAPGDTVRLGVARVPVTGILVEEPDRAGAGVAFGPSVLVSPATLEASGLMQPGTLFRSHTRILLPEGGSPAAAVKALETGFPEAGWRLADRSDGAPGLRRFVTNMGQFLTLVSLAALVVAGVGVGNGVASHLESKSGTIATLKALGASSRLIGLTFLLQLGAVALAAALAGALAGAMVPAVVAHLAAGALPVPPVVGLYPGALLLAVAAGLRVALAFAAPPLVRAAALPAQRLFRGSVERWPWPSRPALLVSGAAALAVVLMGVLSTSEPLFALGFVGAVVALVGLLLGLAIAIDRAARRLPRPRRLLPRLALASLTRPGGQTRQLVVALGLGLTLFATLAFIETSFGGALRQSVPERAPAFFVVDIPREEAERFRAAMPPGSEVAMVPSLRGPLVAVNGVPVAALENPPQAAWVLNGDRGITWAAEPPPGTEITAGRWWPADHAGAPLVSMDAEQAALLGLGVGDTVTVSVLGVELTATIASLRRIDWQGFGFNFALIFDPASLAGAPYSWMATVTPPDAAEAGFVRAVTEAFPTVSVVRVKDVLGRVGELVGQLGVAVRAAASVAILAGIAVLVGAIAASARARAYEAVVLKALGATRRQLLLAGALEYGALGLAVALVALALGALGGWFAVTQVFDLPFRPDWVAALATVLAGAAVTLAFGLVGTARALGLKVAAALREQ